MYEIRIVGANGEVELRYVDELLRAGERLRVDGRRLIVLKRVRPSDPAVKAAFICLEVPAPKKAEVRRAA